MDLRRKLSLLAVLLLAAAGRGQVLKGFHYPDYDEKGQLKFTIVGDEAQVQADGQIQIKNLKMTFYEQGKVVMQVTTPECLFDRAKRSCVSTAKVRVERQEMELTGRGFNYEIQVGRLQISQDARLVVRNPAEQSSGAPQSSATNALVVTATRLNINQSERQAVFEGNVVVVERETRITTACLKVFFLADNKIDRLEAEGAVRIKRNDLIAMSERASYDLKAGKLQLTGQPYVQRDEDTLTGDTVTLWRNSGRVLCEPNARMVIASEQDLRSPRR